MFSLCLINNIIFFHLNGLNLFITSSRDLYLPWGRGFESFSQVICFLKSYLETMHDIW